MDHSAPAENLKIRHDQPDLERSDEKFFSRNYSTMSKVR